MRVEVSLSPALYPLRTIKDGHVTVAIDVLRATTAACAAFQAGCECIVPLNTLEALASYRSAGYLLAAERNGSKVDVDMGNGVTLAAEYGNSPTEYLRHDLRGTRLAYSTTNGTLCILAAADASLTLVGAFANLSALVERLCREHRDTVLLCSGWKGNFCVEDTLVAGAVIESLMQNGAQPSLEGDAAAMALDLWQMAKADVYGFCQTKASHVERLRGLGAEDDIQFAFHTDTCPVVPVFKDGCLSL